MRAAVLPLLLLPGACLAPPAPPPEADPAESRLIEAAVRAEAALAALARTSGTGPAPMPRIVPEPLLRRVTVDWTGPLETLAARLAGQAGYEFAAAGPRPARPPVAELRAKAQPLILAFRDLGLQAGSVAALTVDAERGRVQLDWLPPLREEDS